MSCEGMSCDGLSCDGLSWEGLSWAAARRGANATPRATATTAVRTPILVICRMGFFSLSTLSRRTAALVVCKSWTRT